jgi:hypothetical protein
MEWVLLVDSDERVSDELRREIAAALAGDKEAFALPPFRAQCIILVAGAARRRVSGP